MLGRVYFGSRGGTRDWQGHPPESRSPSARSQAIGAASAIRCTMARNLLHLWDLSDPTRLPAPLGEFYGELARAEARHGELYLELARAAASAAGLADYSARLSELAAIEGQLIVTADEQLRFHSGPPRASVCSS